MGLERGNNSANGGGRFEFKDLLIEKRWAVGWSGALSGWSGALSG